MWPNSQSLQYDLVTLSKETLVGKLHFLYNVNANQREELLAREFHGLLTFFSLHGMGQLEKLYSRRADKLSQGFFCWDYICGSLHMK